MMKFPFGPVFINSLYFYTAFGKKQEIFLSFPLGADFIDLA
jgi:hypothetical protein